MSEDVDNITLASIYRINATYFQMSAKILYEDFNFKGETITYNRRAIPFYYLIFHATELLIKCALLKRGISQNTIKKYPLNHSLSELLKLLAEMNVPISNKSSSLINLVSRQHERHRFRYTALLDNEEQVFTPDPSDLFVLLDELLMLGRISTHGL